MHGRSARGCDRDELTRGAWYTWLTFIALTAVGVMIVLSANYALRPDSGPLSGLWFTLLAALIGCALIGGRCRCSRWC